MSLYAEIEQLKPWYHSVSLPGGEVTPGWVGLSKIWDNIRAVRAGVNYESKRVLDLGSRDGMWAFEAEKLGACDVVATDIGDRHFFDHFLFLKHHLGSGVVPYYNVPVEDLFNRLDCFWKFNPGKFDVIQHLGLFYHLPDPICSLSQCRKSIVDGGTLLFETAVFVGCDFPMARFNSDSGIYKDETTFLAFNLKALFGALRMNRFEPDESSVIIIDQSGGICRGCLIAKAV